MIDLAIAIFVVLLTFLAFFWRRAVAKVTPGSRAAKHNSEITGTCDENKSRPDSDMPVTAPFFDVMDLSRAIMKSRDPSESQSILEKLKQMSRTKISFDCSMSQKPVLLVMLDQIGLWKEHFADIREGKSTWISIFHILENLFRKWNKRRNNKAHKKRFLRKFQNIGGYLAFDPSEFLLTEIVVNAHLNQDHAVVLWLLVESRDYERFASKLIENIKFLCTISVQHRFFFCQGGIIKQVCFNWKNTKFESVSVETYWVLKSLMQCTHTKRRLRDLPDIEWVRAEMERFRPQENTMGKSAPFMNGLFDPIVRHSGGLLHFQEEIKTIICAGCGREEEEQEKFKKCAKCKLAYFCSKKCLKQNYKAKHEIVCVPLNLNN